MTNKFTPGPWQIGMNNQPRSNACNIYTADADEKSICNVYGIWMNKDLATIEASSSCAEGLANAHLIASAPDLLEALQMMVGASEEDLFSRTAYEKAISAIAKATGEKA